MQGGSHETTTRNSLANTIIQRAPTIDCGLIIAASKWKTLIKNAKRFQFPKSAAAQSIITTKCCIRFEWGPFQMVL